MYLLTVIAMLFAVEANQEFTCKPQPGCHFARCSPLWPVTVPALRERNEFPINCVKNGTDPKDEDQDKVLESYKQKISELTDELTEAKEIMEELKKNSDETSKLMANQNKTISKLTGKVVKANKKIKELEKNTDETSKVMANQTRKLSEWMAELTKASRRIKELEKHSALETLEQKFLAMTNDLTTANGRIKELEKKPGTCQIGYRGRCFWFHMDNFLISFDQAKEYCAAHGGKPANIYSKFHYYMLFEYLRMFSRPYAWANAWFGMKYNYMTKSVTLSDGTPAPFVKWFPRFVVGNDLHMIMEASMDRENPNQHMFNNQHTATGVICEK